MQTVSIRDLRGEPLQTLLNIHIQPPALDLIRAAFAQLWPSVEPVEVLRHVDYSLYIAWAVILGLLESVVFIWLWQECGLVMAGAAALFFLFHPAAIFFATFLDTTLLTAFLILASYYLLWKIQNGSDASMLGLSMLTLALFFTRSIFQLPYILLLGACLFLFRAPRRKVLKFLVLTGVISCLFLAKQWYLFRIFSTSSLAGVSLANSVGVGMGTAKYAAYLKDPNNLRITDTGLPDVLIATTKLNGQPNFNNINYLNLDHELMRRYEKQLMSASPEQLFDSYVENLGIYFKPSSTYSSDHVIVERLSWTGLYDWIFSAPVLPALLVLALAVWVVRAIKAHALAQGIGLLLPGLYVLLASVLLDKGENMRFKFFLEPLMFVFLTSQFYVLGRMAYLGAARFAHAR